MVVELFYAVVATGTMVRSSRSDDVASVTPLKFLDESLVNNFQS